MKIALSQINPIIGDLEGNLKLITKAYKEAAAQKADLVIMPELSLTGYPPRDLLDRSHFIKHCSEIINKTASITNDTALIFGAPILKDGNKLYNSAILAHKGKVVFTQDKILLPSYDVFDETRYFTPGDKPKIFEFKGEKLGIMVCEDAWMVPGFSESEKYHIDPVSILAKQGASILINISASPFHADKAKSRRAVVTYHSAKHFLPFALVNQVGGNDELVFDGASFFQSSNGKEIHGKEFEEETLIIDTKNPQPVKLPSGTIIESIYKALILGIKDYIRKCGFKKAVIGLSGGIDSALTAALACAAIGPENVTGLTMPSQYSSSGSISDSEDLASNLGMKIHQIGINDIFTSFIKSLEKIFKETSPGIAEENLQARIRGTILMAYSNKFGHILLSTGNKSELSMGYCTLYGDMNGGLAVLADVLKTDVYKLSNYINRKKEIIPQKTIDKAPSAELRPDQKDSDSLPPYPVLDGILKLFLEDGLHLDEIVSNGYDKNLVNHIINTVFKNEYKRRQAPTGLRVTGKAFGMGRRMPIAAKF